MEKICKKRKSENNYRFLLIVAAALLLAFLVNAFCFTNTRVIGASMSPFLKENDWVITDRLAYFRSMPAFGDIVVIKKPDVIDQPIVKRVIGVPRDTVEISNGRLYRNGKPVIHDFAPMSKSENMKMMTVPENCYFLMGDNREASNDSRRWEKPFVKKDEILGKAVVKYFPEFVNLG